MRKPLEDGQSLFPDFESFESNPMKVNNFHLYFMEVEGSVEKKVFRKEKIPSPLLRKDHPRLDAALLKVVEPWYWQRFSGKGKEKWNQEVVPLLYIAYKLMETYEEIQELLREDPRYLTR